MCHQQEINLKGTKRNTKKYSVFFLLISSSISPQSEEGETIPESCLSLDPKSFKRPGENRELSEMAVKHSKVSVTRVV